MTKEAIAAQIATVSDRLHERFRDEGMAAVDETAPVLGAVGAGILVVRLLREAARDVETELGLRVFARLELGETGPLVGTGRPYGETRG